MDNQKLLLAKQFVLLKIEKDRYPTNPNFVAGLLQEYKEALAPRFSCKNLVATAPQFIKVRIDPKISQAGISFND